MIGVQFGLNLNSTDYNELTVLCEGVAEILECWQVPQFAALTGWSLVSTGVSFPHFQLEHQITNSHRAVFVQDLLAPFDIARAMADHLTPSSLSNHR